MKYKRIYNQAQSINNIVGNKTQSRIKSILPEAEFIGRGACKNVYALNDKVVIKVGRNIPEDLQAYYKIPENLRNRMHAKFYNYNPTDKFLIQKRADSIVENDERPWVEEKFLKLKEKSKEFGLSDVRPANCGVFGNKVKIIDALVSKKSVPKQDFEQEIDFNKMAKDVLREVKKPNLPSGPLNP